MSTYLLTALGLLYGITGASLTRPLRVFAQTLHPVLGTLFSCPPCVGFWLGFGLFFAYPRLWQHPIETAFATSGVGVLLMLGQSLAGMYNAEPE